MATEPEPGGPTPEPEEQLAEFAFPPEGEFVSAQGEHFLQVARAAGVEGMTITSIDGGESGWTVICSEEMMPFAIGAVLEYEGGTYEEPPTEVELLRAELEDLREALRGKADVEG